jgi:hypothetical protein
VTSFSARTGNEVLSAGWDGISRLVALGSTARAVPIDFAYTGSLVEFTDAGTGTY